MKIQCGYCHKPLQETDYLVMDTFNGLKHVSCYTGILAIKDKGPFWYLKNKYYFLNDL